MHEARALLLTALLGLTACQAPSSAPADASPREKEPDAVRKVRELEHARLELRSAEFDAESKRLSARQAMVKAERDLALARRALEAFTEVDAPAQTTDAQIDHDRRVYDTDEARDELAELEAMYQAEEFAKSTKELVLKRGRRRVELAQRELGVSQERMTLLKEHTLPRQQAELAGKVEDAEQELAETKLETEKGTVDADLAIRRARAKIEDLEKELAELAKKAPS
jgi:hypothetical protein